MPSYTVTYSSRVNAPAAVAYGIIADYRDGHPHILPPKYFRNLQVQSGGRGAGTRITFEMGVLGYWRSAAAEVREPEPGRLLEETIPAEQVLTTFLVEAAGENACDVTISTTMPQRAGIAGSLERLTTSAFLRRVYREELGILDRVARSRAAR
jgi:hypothetical protein